MSNPLLKDEGTHYSWPKGLNVPLTVHFSTVEMACKCKEPDCATQRISKELLSRLEASRVEFGYPITVTSGYRCRKHQLYLRSVLPPNDTAQTTSQHELGNAADLSSNGTTILREILAKHFKAMGIAKTFTHVDTRDDKVRRWSYTS